MLGNGKAEDLFSGQDRAFDEHGYISCGPGKKHLHTEFSNLRTIYKGITFKGVGGG